MGLRALSQESLRGEPRFRDTRPGDSALFARTPRLQPRTMLLIGRFAQESNVSVVIDPCGNGWVATLLFPIIATRFPEFATQDVLPSLGRWPVFRFKMMWEIVLGEHGRCGCCKKYQVCQRWCHREGLRLRSDTGRERGCLRGFVPKKGEGATRRAVLKTPLAQG